MNLKRIMLSERNQTRKHTDCTIAFEKEEVRLQGQKISGAGVGQGLVVEWPGGVVLGLGTLLYLVWGCLFLTDS